MKKKRRPVQKTVQKQEQKTSQLLLSRVTQKLDLRQNLRSLVILLLLTSAAVAGRAALQHVPSVEPITPFAILAGFILGPIYGFTAGASAFYASNFFVWGGQGPWTLFQCLGAGLAGFIAGCFGKRWKNFKLYALAMVVGVLAYEFIVTVAMGAMWTGFIGLPFYFLTSIPFMLVHLVSSFGIGAVLWKARDTLPKLGSKIVEKTKFLFGGNHNSGMAPEQVEHEVWKQDGGKQTLVKRLFWRKK